MVGDPEVQVDGDITFDFDARDGKPVRIDTPRPVDEEGYETFWRRTVGQRSFWIHNAQGFGDRELSVVPSSKVSTGSFHFATQWQLMQPMLTARVSGRQDFTIDPNPGCSPSGTHTSARRRCPWCTPARERPPTTRDWTPRARSRS